MTDTDVQMEKNDFTVSAPSGPRLSTTPLSPTSACASEVRYGMSSAPATVVLKAEFAQSYIIQPKISRRSFTGGLAMPMGYLNTIRRSTPGPPNCCPRRRSIDRADVEIRCQTAAATEPRGSAHAMNHLRVASSTGTG